jgi:hypothetical protein
MDCVSRPPLTRLVRLGQRKRKVPGGARCRDVERAPEPPQITARETKTSRPPRAPSPGPWTSLRTRC